MVRLAFLGKFDDEWGEAIFEGEPAAARKAITWARFFLLFHAAFLAVSIVFHFWLIGVLFTCGTFVANYWRYFVGVPMHCGLRDNVADFRLCVRTITLDPISSFLYWHMNWHTEHHMFAAVPTYNLKSLHRALAADMPKPRTLVGAWREMRETWRKQQSDPGYQFNTPLPQRAGAGPAPQDPEGASLGELDT